MRSFGETPGKREALLNKLVKISETPVKREETPEKGEEPRNMCTALEKLEEKGREEGKLEGKREMILAFLKAGADTWMIKKASGWSEEEIEAIRRKME